MKAFFDNLQKTNGFPRKRKRNKRLLLLCAIVAILTSISLLIILKPSSTGTESVEKSSPGKKIKKHIIMENWQSREYRKVYDACQTSLEIDPLDSFYLTFKGFSIFYIGIAEVDGELRLKAMDEAIFAFRKALIHEKLPLFDMVNYVLGKAYFYKGFEYFDDSLTAFNAAVNAGCNSTDIWEYMALASQELGLLDDSIVYFQKALQLQSNSPELILAAAKAYLADNNLQETERLAHTAMRLTPDEFIQEQARYLLLFVYENGNRYEDAFAIVEALKVSNSNSADVFFHEGIIFSLTGDAIKARASWRKAVAIDPMHAGARQRLFDRP